MSCFQLLTDARFDQIADQLPGPTGQRGRPFADARGTIEGIIYRLRAGIPWRDLPECFDPWQTVHRWHHRMATDGAWDVALERLLARADAEGLVD